MDNPETRRMAAPRAPLTASGRTRWSVSLRLVLCMVLALSAFLGAAPKAPALADSQPGVTVNDVTKTRPPTGTTTFAFTITLEHPTNNTAYVTYATQDYTARSTFDYQPLSGTATFLPGKTTATVNVIVNGTTLHTGSRYFNLLLNSASYATIMHNVGRGTIVDPTMTPYLNVSDATVVQGSGTSNTAVFNVTLTNPDANTVKVHYATGNSSAVAGADYTYESGTLSFPAGVTSRQVSVPIASFNGFQGRKDFTLQLYNPVNALLEDNQGDGVILNTNHAAYLTTDDTTVAEPGSGTTTVQVPIRVAAPVSFPVTVAYATGGGSAVSGTDYTPASGTVTIPANTSQVTAPVTIKANGLSNTSRTIVLSLSAPSAGVNWLRSQSVITIYAGGYLQFAVQDSAVLAPASGSTNMTFTVTATPAPTTSVSVHYQTADSSALAGADYTSTNGNLSFAAGVSTQTFTVPILAHTSRFDDRLFSVNLSAQTSGLIERAQGLGEIEATNVVPMISISSGAVQKPASGTVTLPFVFTLSSSSSNTVSMNYSTSNGSAQAGSDYNSASGVVSFAPGTTSQTVNVTVNSSTLSTGDRIFYMQTNTPVNGQQAGNTGYGEIQDPNRDPTIAINNVAVYKPQSGTATAKFAVSLSSASSNTVSVQYSTSNGSASSGVDYNAASGTLTFAPGTTSQTISVAVLGNTLSTGDRYFYVNLGSPTNTSLTSSEAIGTIIDSSIEPYLSVTSTAVQKPATGTANMIFTVTLAPASPNTVTVNYQTSNGSAVAGTDYTSVGGTLTFAPGTSSKTVSVPVTGSTVHTADRYLYLYLSSPSNALLAYQSSNLGWIIDPTFSPLVTVDDSFVRLTPTTGTQTMSFTVHVYPSNANTVTVNYATSDGSASSGSDYTAVSGTLTFPAGTTSQTVSVPILNNGQTTDRYFYFGFSSPTNAQISGRSSAYGLIIANASTQSYFTVRDAAVAKPASGTVNEAFTVDLFPSQSGTVYVNYNTADGSATAASGDYNAARGTLTFGPGVTSQTVNVTVNGNTFPGADKYFTLNVSANTGSTTIWRGASYGFILNGQPGSRTSMGPDLVINRGDSGSQTATFSVSLSSPQLFPVQLDYTTNDGNITSPDGYVGDSGTIVFSPGQTTQTVGITVPGNPEFTGTNYFYLATSNPINSTQASTNEEAIVYNLDTFAITGKVIGPSGAGAAGVQVTRSGNNQPSVSVTTASDGTFSIPNTIDGVYKVTPTLAGTTFLPANQNATVLGANLSLQPFLGYSGVGITGSVADQAGKATPGITMTLSGGGLGSPVTTTTDSLGYYAFGNVAAASGYVVTPSASGYAFNPNSYTVNVTASTVNSRDFVALQGVYIAGQVTTSTGAGDSMVTITRSGGGAASVTVKTNSQGYYGISNNPATSGGVAYTITPSKTGATFTPTSATATVSTTANATGVNFTQN